MSKRYRSSDSGHKRSKTKGIYPWSLRCPIFAELSFLYIPILFAKMSVSLVEGKKKGKDITTHDVS